MKLRRGQVSNDVYMWNLKKLVPVNLLQNKVSDVGKNTIISRAKMRGIHWETGIDIYTLLYIK